MPAKKKPEKQPEPAAEPEVIELNSKGRPRWVKGPDGQEFDCLTLEPRK